MDPLINIALINASERGNLEKVKVLVNSGANIHANNNASLRLASKGGHLEVVKYLIENGENIHSNEALELASREGYLDIVKFLINNGACHPDIQSIKDRALESASREGHLDIVKFLIDNGANVHAYNNIALRVASQFGHLNIVKLLVENGANIHSNANASLGMSIFYGHVEVVEFLINKRANWRIFKNYQIIKNILKSENNLLLKILTTSYLSLYENTPKIIINNKPKLKIPKQILLKMVYESLYTDLCSNIRSDQPPPLKLIALANIMRLDFDIDISWINLCDKIRLLFDEMSKQKIIY